MKTFVISDTHFGHENIIRYCNRPYKSVEEMDTDLIMKWNSIVGPEDRVIHNGDYMFYKTDPGYFDHLNGQKELVKGNHDKHSVMKLGWKAIHDVLEFNHGSKRIVMHHYPYESWNHMFHGSIHLYGHVHEKILTNIKNRYNICVEWTNYSPVNLDYYTSDQATSIDNFDLKGN